MRMRAWLFWFAHKAFRRVHHCLVLCARPQMHVVMLLFAPLILPLLQPLSAAAVARELMFNVA